METIATELHCSTVRITGADPERLTVAARFAIEAGLTVWFSPFPCDMGGAQLLDYFADCASRAEELRESCPGLVLVLGCELSVFAEGFVRGDDMMTRLMNLSAAPNPALNRFLRRAARHARKRFGGPLTYASGNYEHIDWSPFDIVSVDHYRDARNAPFYRSQLREYRRYGKPVAITEFGCCPYRGAGGAGGAGWAIVEDVGGVPHVPARYERDEGEQVRYFTELLDVFDADGVDSAFWFTFAAYSHPRHDDPRLDLDLAGYGVVSPWNDGNGVTDTEWTRRRVFTAMAERYGRSTGPDSA